MIRRIISLINNTANSQFSSTLSQKYIYSYDVNSYLSPFWKIYQRSLGNLSLLSLFIFTKKNTKFNLNFNTINNKIIINFNKH